MNPSHSLEESVSLRCSTNESHESITCSGFRAQNRIDFTDWCAVSPLPIGDVRAVLQ